MTFPCRLLGAMIPLTLASLATAAELPADKLAISGLPPAKVFPDICVLKYRVSTASPECQAFFDQGLAYFYSYVWLEAVRSFETAVRHDPDCAMAWWGLSRALDSWDRAKRGSGDDALKKAKDLLDRASHGEQMLITSRLQERGLMPGVAEDARKKTAARTLDDLLALYDDDEEAWFCRAKLAESGLAAVPYYKALLRLNPLHPGANHELVHFYEGYRRPALGWLYAENYIRSSPGIPHPFHMQAHLATRIGRWEKTSDRSARAIELQRAYHKEMNVKAGDDWQWTHHLEILTLSLIHDGRFREARAIKEEALRDGIRHPLPWFRLHLAERDWAEAQKVIDDSYKKDKLTAAYLGALLHLKQGALDRAAADVEVLREAYQSGKGNKQLEFRLWETQGQLLCAHGAVDCGLPLLFKTIERTKDDFTHHAWGNGAYYMEVWGLAALHGGKDDVAAEAFQEALAHDPGSVRAALGMGALCARQGRPEEAAQFDDLARRCWRRADPEALPALRAAEFTRTTETQNTQR